MPQPADTAALLGDAITERPLLLTVGEGKGARRYSLRPMSLGRTLEVERLLSEAGFSAEAYSRGKAEEALRCVVAQPDAACRAIATALAPRRRGLTDSRRVARQAKWLKANFTAEDAATLLMTVVDIGGAADEIMRRLGLDREREDMRSAMRAKGSSSSVSFGGRSVYGTLIDAACERYGWTMGYTVWGVSLTNLLLLMADKVSSVYLTKEERRKARLRHTGERINGDDPKNIGRLKSIFSD